MNFKTQIRVVASIAKKIVLFFGGFFLVLLALSFTDLPFTAYRSLAEYPKKAIHKPYLIVCMGASGMPSPDGLIRCYYTAKLARANPQAKVCIALAESGLDSLSQNQQMLTALRIRGVDVAKIEFANSGFNTHSQAIEIAQMYKGALNREIVVVSSPEHIYRACKTFEQAGFTKVRSKAAFANAIAENDLQADSSSSNSLEPNLSLRYNFWSYLHYELLVLREYSAITYYYYKGWL